MNNVNLLGRLTADPELRQTTSGIASCRFTIAVNRKFKNRETGEYDADFISCVAWRQTAEFITRYFNKGSMICVSGSLRSGSYTDKNHSDVTHYTTDVFVDGVEFTGEKRNDGNTSNQQQQQKPQYDSVNDSAGNQYAKELQQAAAQQQEMSFEGFEELLNEDDMPF